MGEARANSPSHPRAPRLPPVLDPDQAEAAYKELLQMNLPELSCSGGGGRPGTCIFHMALEQPHLLEIFVVEGIFQVTRQIYEHTDAKDNLEMSGDVSSASGSGGDSSHESGVSGGGADAAAGIEEDDGEDDGSETGDGDVADDVDITPTAADELPNTDAAAAVEELPPATLSNDAPSAIKTSQGPAKRPKRATTHDLRVNLRGPVPAEMMVAGEWLAHHVSSGEGNEGIGGGSSGGNTTAYDDRWVEDIIRRGQRPSATKFAIMCYLLFSMMSKFRDFADVLYSGCCRWRRGEHEFLSAFRTCLDTMIRDTDSISVTAETALITYTWTCDDLLEVYHSAVDPRICISYKLLSIEQQDQRPLDQPGIPWPIHPSQARYPDKILDAAMMVGMSQIEKDALPTNGHRGDAMQVTG